MPDRIIPIADFRTARPRIGTALSTPPANGLLLDNRARQLHDLRISVTDRCNFRCTYCMPKEVFGSDYPYLPHAALLSFEEIARLARLFVAHGVEKIRLTGGEPLLRKNVEALVAMLADIRIVHGPRAGQPLDLTLTTNASLLERKAKALRDAGLKRVTVSLDGLDDAIFRSMNDVDFPVATVLRGIAAAERAGLAPLKINMVVKRGVNDSQILPMARHFRHSGHIVRFIEYMDVGASNGWKLDEVLPSSQVISIIHNEFPLQAIDANYTGEVAGRWRYADGGGEIGVISSVTQAFCGTCTRARLSTEGRIYTCLFATTGHDLRNLLRNGASDEELSNEIAAVWQQRGDRYSELRGAATAALPKIEMSYIGG